MDYMESFSDEQIRVLYCIFSNLSLREMRSSGSMPEDDHVHIILRKQLGHCDPGYKKVGILGCVAVIASFGTVLSADTELLEPQYQYVEQLWETVIKTCVGQPQHLALLYDELSQSLDCCSSGGGRLHERIVTLIFDKVSEEVRCCSIYQDMSA